MSLDEQQMKKEEYEKKKDICQQQQLDENDFQIISYSQTSQQQEPDKQNKETSTGYFDKGFFTTKIAQITGFLKNLIQNNEDSSLNKNACEILLGLDQFTNINGRDYTKEEFDQKFNRYLLFEDPNKQLTETLKQNALKRSNKFQQAKNIIYKQNGWEE